MSKKLNVASVVHPTDRPTQDEWMEQLRVSSGYVAPTPYFQGNEFDTRIFLRTEDAGHNVSWQEWLWLPFEIILKLGQQLW